MYEGGKGMGAIGSGAIILPNTGGNTLLKVAAYAVITIGAAILISTVVRLVAKRVYAKA